MNIPRHSVCLQPYNPKRKLGYARRWAVDPQPLSKTILKDVWSPIVWRDGRRLRENFLYADWLVLDFDDSEIPLENAVNNIFCDMVHLIGTTKSHAPPSHCYRVCLPFEKRITDLSLYEGNVKFYADKYEADPKPTNGATPFYPCKEIISKKHTGFFADVYPDKINEDAEPWDGRLTPLSFYALSIISKNVVAHGERDTTAFRVAKDLLKTGMSEAEVLCALKAIKFSPALSERYLEVKVASASKQLRRKNVEEKKANVHAESRTTPLDCPGHGYVQEPEPV